MSRCTLEIHGGPWPESRVIEECTLNDIGISHMIQEITLNYAILDSLGGDLAPG